MFYTRKNKKTPTPSILNWAVIAFIAFAVLKHSGITEKKILPEKGDYSLHGIGKAIQENGPSGLQDFQSKIMPGEPPSLQIQDIDTGSGAPALCGQKIRIAYRAFLEDGHTIDDGASKDKPLVMRIGEGKVVPALERGTLGMRPGGRRNVFSPPGLAYGMEPHTRKDVAEDASVKFEIEMLGTEPTLPDLQDTSFRFLDTQASIGRTIACGSPAKVQMNVWSTEGNKLYTTYGTDHTPLSFAPGEGKVFMGLEQGVLGMKGSSKRTLIVPPLLQKTSDGGAPTPDIAFPKDQTVLVDIESVP